MPFVNIPNWNAVGVLPPIDPDDPVSPHRSPYLVSLSDFIYRFSTTTERREILSGLLNFRLELHQLGLNRGFQWLDGSFLENVEVLENRPPQDLDVVTFFQEPANFISSDSYLFDNKDVKERFLLDSYFIGIDETPPAELVLWSAYWYSMWSHRRNGTWKGFLQIELTPQDEGQLQEYLAQFEEGRGVI